MLRILSVSIPIFVMFVISNHTIEIDFYLKLSFEINLLPTIKFNIGFFQECQFPKWHKTNFFTNNFRQIKPVFAYCLCHQTDCTMGLILEKVTQSKLKNKLMIDHFVMVVITFGPLVCN